MATTTHKGTASLGTIDAAATVAVKDLARARKFYEETLGLTPIDTEGEEAVMFRAGNSRVLVYQSQFAGTNQATAITWGVGNRLEELVRSLRDAGVRFEHYDMPETTREGDIHVAGRIRIAWFKDPDGNIIALVSE